MPLIIETKKLKKRLKKIKENGNGSIGLAPSCGTGKMIEEREFQELYLELIKAKK